MLYPYILMTLMVYINDINDKEYLFRQVHINYYGNYGQLR
jgi:hypothetical protein